MQPIQQEKLQTRVGRKIRQLRRKNGLGQKKLASDAEIDRAMLSILENGHKAMTLATLEKIANALGVEPSELLKD